MPPTNSDFAHSHSCPCCAARHSSRTLANCSLPAQRADRLQSEHAVTLELRLAEPLLGRRLVRERCVRARVVGDVDRLVAEERRLQVEEHAVLEPGIDRRVADRSRRRSACRLRGGPMRSPAGSRCRCRSRCGSAGPRSRDRRTRRCRRSLRRSGRCSGSGAAPSRRGRGSRSGRRRRDSTYGFVLVVLASSSLTSGATPNVGAARLHVRRRAAPGLPSQTPSRALNTVSRNVMARDAFGAHVRAHRRARRRQRLAEGDAGGIRRRGPIAELPRPGMERAHRERRGLALGDRELVVGDEVERRVDDVQWPAELLHARERHVVGRRRIR